MQSLCISMDYIGVLTISQIPPIPDHNVRTSTGVTTHAAASASTSAIPAARQRMAARGGGSGYDGAVGGGDVGRCIGGGDDRRAGGDDVRRGIGGGDDHLASWDDVHSGNSGGDRMPPRTPAEHEARPPAHPQRRRSGG